MAGWLVSVLMNSIGSGQNVTSGGTISRIQNSLRLKLNFEQFGANIIMSYGNGLFVVHTSVTSANPNVFKAFIQTHIVT